MTAIKTEKLCKFYGNQQVLHDISLEVQPGRLVGFLGPNGAGKSTTIRILLGLLAANSGESKIFGKPTRSFGKQIRSEIGYLPGDVHFYANLTARATLEFMARARKKNCDVEINRLANRFKLELNKKTVRKFSTGMRQKLGLIQALMHRPQLLILDEPTSGLDPLVRETVFDELRSVIDEGRTVLFSSHSLDEVEQLCDEVIILREGRIVEQQLIDVMRNRALRRVEITFAEAAPSQYPPEFQQVESDSHSVRATWTGEMPMLLDWLKPFEVVDLIIERPDLNDLFITYYSDSISVDSA